jgi:integrase
MKEAIRYRGIVIQRHGARWRWRSRGPSGVIVQSAPTLDEAKALLGEHLADRAFARFDAETVTANRPTVGELCDAWFRSKTPTIAPATVQQYGIHIRVHIKPLIGELNADTIRPLELEIFYASLRWKPAKESHNILRQAFEWGIRNDVLARESNPCLVVRPSRRACKDHDGFFDSNERIKPVDEKDIPTSTDIEKLLIDATTRPAWLLYLKFAAATGARPGEICALQRKHIDPKRGTVRIEWAADRIAGRIKRPKTPSGVRTLHLAPEFFAEISSMLPGDPEAFLFPSNTHPGGNSPLPCWNSRSVTRRLSVALARTGLRPLTPHSFRHFVATQMLDQGHSPIQVARFLGHANDSLVRALYGNHIIEDSQKAIGHAASRLVR